MRIAMKPTHRRRVSRSMLGLIGAVAILTVTARATPPPRSIQLDPIGTHATGIFDQAENRVHAQKAVLVWLLGTAQGETTLGEQRETNPLRAPLSPEDRPYSTEVRTHDV